MKNGFGVVMDDLAAGVYAWAALLALPAPRGDPVTLHVEILSTGDELLTGQVVDTNSAWLMDRLWDLGVMVRRKTLVGDDRDDLDAAIRETSARADVVVMSGGMGPTEDDLTTECVAAVLGVPLELHEPSLRAIEERFRQLRPDDDAEQREAGALPARRRGDPEPVRDRARVRRRARARRGGLPARRAGRVQGALRGVGPARASRRASARSPPRAS